MIAMLNIIIQHYKVGTSLVQKVTALQEALQLETGCTGNPLDKDYKRYHMPATPCWVKSLW
jgi:hypothetical protein